MAQLEWVTPPGSLGTIPEGVFYATPLIAVDPDLDPVKFEVIAGNLPAGVAVNPDGILTGVPTVVTPANKTYVSKFAVRAYTTQVIHGVTVIKNLADRTFTLTVAPENIPQFITPAGQIAELYDGSLISNLQVQFTGGSLTSGATITVAQGQLPPSLTLDPLTGVISGLLYPNIPPGGTPGFSVDGQGWDTYPFDFNPQSVTTNYQFTLAISNGVATNLRTFSILVLSRSSLTADNTYITADDTYITADETNVYTPIIINKEGSIGSVRSDNNFAYQFIAYNFNAAAVTFQGFTLPPGLTLDPNSGWLYGYIPDLGLTTDTYNFSIQVFQNNDPEIVSEIYYYSLTISGAISSSVTWITPDDLGYIDNGATSTFYVEAVNVDNVPLLYRLDSGSYSLLPQGLQLLSSGEIAGRVSFDTFALDGGTTTFDSRAAGPDLTFFGTPTTFDLKYDFIVNAYSVDGVVDVTHQFTIHVVRRYDQPYDNLYIQAMPPEDDRALINSLIQNGTIFPQELIYRFNDPNFGIAKNVVYYHAYGLTAATLDDYVTALQLNHYWKNLVLGQVKTAQARDALGNVIYEVVYSQIIDDLVNVNTGASVGKEVILPFPIENNTIDTVYPNALVDMRNQVIDTVGQVSNVLPLWMTSKQADGNVLGFTPAWVIAYTKPGASGQIQYNIQTMFGEKLNLVDFEVDRYELDNLLTKNWDRDTQEWIPHPPTLTTFDQYTGPDSPVYWKNNYNVPIGWLGQDDVPVTWVNNGLYYPFGTIFDGGSLQFITPVDMYSNTTDYDKYLLFPKRNILR